MLELIIAGNVHHVLNGTVTKKRLQTVKFAYGLGSGSLENKGELKVGEGIFYDNQAYVFIPDKTWTGKEVETPFMMGFQRLPMDEVNIDETLTINDLYTNLLQKYALGFGIVGKIHCDVLETAYLKKAPIFHENINDNSDKYWENEKRENASIKIVGVVLPYLNNAAFYDNPNDSSQSSQYYSHTHALVENNSPRHLLTQTQISKARLFVEEIKV